MRRSSRGRSRGSRGAVRAEAGLDTGGVKRIDLLLRAREETEVEVPRRRSPVGDVEVRKRGVVAMVEELRDPEGRERRFVEANARGVVARVDVEVVGDPP